MNAIQTYFEQAELALAAYGDLPNGTLRIADLTNNSVGMANTQAQSFATRYTVLAQYNGEVIRDYIDEFGNPQQFTDQTGLSVTLFADASGKRYVAIRGTELSDGNDVITDLASIVTLGTTKFQAQYAALKAKIDQWLIDPAMLQGQSFTIAGHSLGGFLAGGLMMDMGSRIDYAYLYNAPGVGGVGDIAGYLARVGEYLGIANRSTDPAKISNLVGSEGLSLVAGIGSPLSPQVTIQAEAQSNPLNNHSMVVLTDALAVYDLLARIAPGASIEELGSLIKASSAQMSDTLESLTAALGKLFLTTAPTVASLSDRNSLYQAIYGIRAALPASGLTLVSLVDKTPVGLAGLATNGDIDAMAYRYALKELNPFAVLGADYSAHQSSLSLYDPATGLGLLTSDWLTDRSAMLSGVITARTADTGTGDKLFINPTGADAVLYTDKQTGLTLRDGQTALDPKRITFGSGNGETITGGLLTDRLYGMAGNDNLNGGGAADHLEGGAGDDALVGGAGDDILVGGTGNDVLRGGKGIDTYRIDKSGGVETIIDYAADGLADQFLRPAESGDGQGLIEYAGAAFSGALVQDATERNRYHWAGNSALIIRYIGDPAGRGNLLVTDPAGATFKVMNWKTGELGLTLQATASAIQTTDQQGTGQADNAYLTNQAHGASLTASTENEEVFGLDGSDVIDLAFSGAIGRGGSGNDILRNGAGSQTLYGEDGNDILVASSGDDTLDGGIGDDALQGGADDDRLEGGDGNDILDGGAGSDVINGGAGDDFIFGGGNVTVGLSEQTGPYSYNSFADGEVVMLSKDAAGQLILPGNLSGVSGTDSHVSEALAYHVEGDGADAIDGGDGDDMVFAGDGDDVVQGGAGKDYLVGEVGNDFIEGGADDDILHGDGAEGDLIPAGDGNSFVTWTLDEFHGDDYLDGGDGDDFVSGDGGADMLFGGSGNDTLIGDSNGVADEFHGDDYLDGEEGDDKLYGYGGDDILLGGTGNDFIEGDASTVAQANHGDDWLDGEDGDDKLQGDGGSDTLIGGSGNDQLFGDADDIAVEYQGDDTLDGGEGNDYLRGYGGNDLLIGGTGNDQLLAEAGDDELDGGDGDDILSGGEGNDTLIGGAGVDWLEGGTGDDTYILAAGDGTVAADGTTEAISDEAGFDTLKVDGVREVSQFGSLLLVDYGTDDRVAIVDGLAGAIDRYEVEGESLNAYQLVGRYASGPITTTTPENTPLVLAGNGSDDLTVSAGDTTISAGQGDDLLAVYGDGNTILYSVGDGADTLVTGGTGNVLKFFGATAGDLKLSLAGDALVIQVGSSTNDTLRFLNFDPTNILEQRPFDRIEFDDGSSLTYAELIGTGLNLSGTDGDDVLTGSNLDDNISAGSGNDILTGGQGNDTLAGEGGADVYRFMSGSGTDTVIDGGAETNVLRFESWRTPGDLHTVQEGNDLRLIVRGTSDSVILKDYYSGEAQYWQVDFDGANATELETIIAQPNESTSMINALWLGTKDQVINAQIWTAENSYTNYVGPLGGVIGWRNLGNLRFEVPWIANPRSSYSQQVTTTVYRDLNGVITSTQVNTDESEEVTYWGYGASTIARRSIYQYEVARIESDDSLIVNSSYSWNETVDGSAIATLVWEGYNLNPQHSTWNTSGIVTDQYGTAIGTVQYFYDLTTYDRSGWVLSFDNDTSGWSAPANTVIGNQVAVDYQMTIQHQPLVTELVGGSGNNEIHAESGATEFVDGGAGNDTIFGGGGAMGRGDLLYGNSGDDTIYGDGSVMAGGDGNDVLIGGQGADRYLVLSSEEVGTDVILDRGEFQQEFKQWYYEQQGVGDYQDREAMAGKWVLWNGQTGEIGGGIFDSRQEVESYLAEYYPEWTVDTLLAMEELVEVAPLDPPLLGNSKDFRLTNGIPLPRDVVELPENVTRDDLTFGWGSHTDENNVTRATLEVSWGGVNRLRVVMPRADDPVGFGIDYFKFADGSTLWMSDLINIAPPMPNIGDDTLVGNGESNDLVASTDGSHLFGMDGDDELVGSTGDDTLNGGYGDDLMAGREGNDIYVFRRGDGFDTIYDHDNTQGNIDTVLFDETISPEDIEVFAEGGDLFLSINDGSGTLCLSRWADGSGFRIEQVKFMDGTTWDTATLAAMADIDLNVGEIIEGLASDEVLVGTPFDDEIYGNEGNDIIIGGEGDDFIDGGSGSNTYVFGPNDGHDMLEDMDGAPASIPTDINTIRFVDGIAPDDVTIERNEYGGIVLSVHDGASSVSFWAQPELMPTVEFSDGTTWGVDELIGNTVLDYGFFAEVIGSTGNDTLVATLPAPITIHGLDGNDTLVASDSGSWLIGGSGDDTLIGNTGDDWYFMDAHSGQDVLIETADNGSRDGLDIGPDISPDQIRFVRYAGDNGNDLIVSVEGTDAELTISNWFDPVAPARLEGFYFWNDDTELFDDALGAAIWADNTAPIFTAVDPEARVGVAFSLDLNNLLSDPDEDRLVYEVTLADGSPLLGWLELDSATGILSGTPETADAGTLDIHLSGTDGGGLAASGTFSLNVVAVIDEPPTVTAESTTLLLDAVTPITDLISITGNVQSYQFWDDVNGGGHFVLNGIAQPSGTSITVAADQIDLLQYAAGSETGVERVWARVSDGNTWSTWTPWNITSAPHLTNEAPIANADNLTIGLGEAVAASGMFSVADADGDVPTKYEFWDDSASGGRFVLGGIDQSAGTSIAIASDQLADLKYVGDSAISTERVWVRAFDGQAWSAWKSWNITSAPHPTNEAPVISATDGTVGLNTLVAAGTLFSVTDADGDVATKYEFWDDGQGGGHFVLNGVDQAAGTSIAVNADQLADFQYVGAGTMGSERVWARAWDGQAWSSWKSWNMLSSNHATNAAPEASAANATLLLGEAVAVSSLFSASDIDGDPIVKYEFWDDVNGGGHFSKGGIEQAAGVSIAVPADELSEVAYVAGSQTGSERVWVRASDGVAWGAWTPWNMASAAHLTNAAPVITAPTGIAGLGQAVAAASLFSVVDPDGDVPSKYEFWDDTNGGGYFAKNGIAQASGTSISVTTDELPDLTYVGGNAMTSERVWVRAYDGQAWSSWTAWNMQSSDHETNAAPTITTANRGVLAGDALAASSLFSATDIDGDAAVKFEFWDDVNGGGYFAKAGVQQAAGTSIAVSATDLADLSYVGGTAAATERVWVRANDGLAWSGWTSWNMTTVTGLQRGSPGGDNLIANGEILLGNEGNDSLSGPTGNNLLFGGAGDDMITSGPGSNFIAGGAGNDTIITGSGNDVIAFNAGDGSDAIYLNGGMDTISLGGGIRYQDLALSKNGNDLVLDTGNGESLTFKDWYADSSHQSALNMQLIAESMADFDANGGDPLLDNTVEDFDFRALVDRFDLARAQNAAITQWNLMNDLLDTHLFGADDEAFGGDLAYQYGRYGNFSNVGLTGAQNVLNGSQFAIGPQTFQSLQGLQEGVARLG